MSTTTDAVTDTTTQARQIVASNVRAVLGRKKSNQTALAKVLGKSQAAASRRLSGELPFDTDELLRICEHYRVPLSDLVAGIEADDFGRPIFHDLQGSVQLGLFYLAA